MIDVIPKTAPKVWSMSEPLQILDGKYRPPAVYDLGKVNIIRGEANGERL